VTAEPGEAGMDLDHRIRLVAVGHQQAPAIQGVVHGVTGDCDVHQPEARERHRLGVVVPRQIHHPPAPLGALQDMAEQLVIVRLPAHPAAHDPQIHDVPDQIQALARRGLEKRERQIGSRTVEAEVEVGEEDAPHREARRGRRPGERSGDRHERSFDGPGHAWAPAG